MDKLTFNKEFNRWYCGALALHCGYKVRCDCDGDIFDGIVEADLHGRYYVDFDFGNCCYFTDIDRMEVL